MQKRQLDDGYRLYLTPNEYELCLDLVDRIPGRAHPLEIEVLCRLGGESGFRADESIRACMNDIIEPADPSLDVKFIETWGKDTTGETEAGKYRKSVLTKSTAARIDQLVETLNRDDDEPFFDWSRSTVDNYIPDLGEIAAEESGKEDFKHLTVHDFRAYFATNCLVRHDMNVETVMTVGGWDDYETMQNYLALTSDDQIVQDFDDAGLLEGIGWEKYQDAEPEDGSIYERLSATTPMGTAAQFSALGAEQMATRIEEASALHDQVQNEQRSIGRFTPAETKTAIRAGKYGAFVGVAAAGLAGSVAAIGPDVALPLAFAALIPPLYFGWHKSE